MKQKLISAGLGVALAISTAGNAFAGEVEVLHYWTSGGEARSVAELKRLLESKGHSWKDMAVAGGGGESAATVLKSRVLSGNPPTAAQIKGPSIQEWGDEGVLASLSSVGAKNNWDSLLPKVVADVMKYEGNYVAVPVNVHRVNWMWANPEVFRKSGATIPTTWDDFFVAADKIKAAGFTPVAHGGQAWQDATVFESIVLGVGGADLYRKAFVELDSKALGSDAMVKSFETLRKVKSYTDKDAPGRDWNLATSMVINGKAAMQFMGDWAKGEFTAAGKAPGTDYICLPAPGTSGAFTFNVDSFIIFDGDDSVKEAREAFAATIMEPEFQEVFNLNKGSIPARLNMPRDKFDSCAHSSMDTFVASAQDGGLVPSMAHGMSTYPAIQGAIYDVVTNFYNSDLSASDATKKLVSAVQANK
ncbi:MAG: carbohydrate ABC transporter substrate-binding protein [Gammaproteobacteria bacterium]|nr:carbohydrate ABC transporter substrate-binding protein [Gammaproteobacteria bacterium]